MADYPSSLPSQHQRQQQQRHYEQQLIRQQYCGLQDSIQGHTQSQQTILMHQQGSPAQQLQNSPSNPLQHQGVVVQQQGRHLGQAMYGGNMTQQRQITHSPQMLQHQHHPQQMTPPPTPVQQQQHRTPPTSLMNNGGQSQQVYTVHYQQQGQGNQPQQQQQAQQYIQFARPSSSLYQQQQNQSPVASSASYVSVPHPQQPQPMHSAGGHQVIRHISVQQPHHQQQQMMYRHPAILRPQQIRPGTTVAAYIQQQQQQAGRNSPAQVQQQQQDMSQMHVVSVQQPQQHPVIVHNQQQQQANALRQALGHATHQQPQQQQIYTVQTQQIQTQQQQQFQQQQQIAYSQAQQQPPVQMYLQSPPPQSLLTKAGHIVDPGSGGAYAIASGAEPIPPPPTQATAYGQQQQSNISGRMDDVKNPSLGADLSPPADPVISSSAAPPTVEVLQLHPSQRPNAQRKSPKVPGQVASNAKTARAAAVPAKPGQDDGMAVDPSLNAPGFDGPKVRLLDRVGLEALVKEVDPYETLEDDVTDAVLLLVDNFVDEIIKGASDLSKHRGAKRVESRDVQYLLNGRLRMALPGAGGSTATTNSTTVPGLSGIAGPAPKRPALVAHQQRMALIDKTLKKL